MTLLSLGCSTSVTRAGIAAAALLFVIILTVLSLQIKLRKRRYRGNESNIEEILKGYDSLIPKRYRYSDLKKITGSFKDNLGEGGYGTVFKGNLKDGRKGCRETTETIKRKWRGVRE